MEPKGKTTRCEPVEPPRGDDDRFKPSEDKRSENGTVNAV